MLQRTGMIAHPVQQRAELAVQHGVGQRPAAQFAGGRGRARHVAGLEQATRAVQPEPVATARAAARDRSSATRRAGAASCAATSWRGTSRTHSPGGARLSSWPASQRLPQVTGFDAAGDPIRHAARAGARRSRSHAPSERIGKRHPERARQRDEVTRVVAEVVLARGGVGAARQERERAGRAFVVEQVLDVERDAPVVAA